MIRRELSPRQVEILCMIKRATFQDIVGAVRREVENSRYDARRQLRNLKNRDDGNNDNDRNGETNRNS